MALKYAITNDEYNNLPADVQREYSLSASGYSLQTVGKSPVVTQLEQALDTARTESARLQSDLRVAQETVRTVKETTAAETQTALETANKLAEKRGEALLKAQVDTAVSGITSKFKHPKLFDATVRSNISAEFDEQGNIVMNVLDDKGQATTLEKFTKSLLENKDYSDMLATTTSSGTLPNLEQNLVGGLPPATQPAAGSNRPSQMSAQAYAASFVARNPPPTN